MTTVRKTPTAGIKTLAKVFDDAATAHSILTMVKSELNAHPVGAARIKECHHAPDTWDIRLHILNDLGGFHGVESIESTKGEFASYLNAGDCYALTVIYWRGRYRVQSLGDFVETMECQGVKFK